MRGSKESHQGGPDNAFSVATVHTNFPQPRCKAQLVTCLTVVTCLIADPGLAFSIPARSPTFLEIDHKNKLYSHTPPF